MRSVEEENALRRADRTFLKLDRPDMEMPKRKNATMEDLYEGRYDTDIDRSPARP